MNGQAVCRSHGGATALSRAAAQRRIQEMVAPALARLRELIDDRDNPQTALAAVRDVLDRAGHKLPERVESGGTVQVQIEYVTAPTKALVSAHKNGAT